VRSLSGVGGALVGAIWLLGAGCGDSSCSDAPGTICPWAGNGMVGYNGDGLPLEESRLYWPVDVTFTSSGDTYVLDWNNHIVRRVEPDGTFRTVIGTGFVGDGPPDLSDLTPPGAPGLEVDLNHPTQLIEESPDRLILVSWHNHKLRSFDPATGLVLVECGRGAGFDGDGSLEDALLNQPAAARFDAEGRLYVLDQRNQRIRRIDTLGPGGTIETVVGMGTHGFSGDGGPPLEAQVAFPPGTNPPPAGSLTFDHAGRLYFADTDNHRIRRVDFDADVIETVLGDGDPATLNNPRDVELGPDGRIYIADERNHRVLALDTEDLSVEVVAGTGQAGEGGDGGPATEAMLRDPTGLAFDGEGHLYISDTGNHRIRVVRGGW
jgi:DNA-binding beta-propeller fold protein YncE